MTFKIFSYWLTNHSSLLCAGNGDGRDTPKVTSAHGQAAELLSHQWGEADSLRVQPPWVG